MFRSLCQGVGLTAALLAPLRAQNGTDTCVAPTPISEGIYSYDTTTMVTSQDLTVAPCGSLDFHQDMFWVYTATGPGELTIESRSTEFDTQLAVYAGVDCMATCIRQNDDIAWPINSNSRVIVPNIQAGDTFVIQTGGWRFESGAGTLEVSVDPPPANDDCSGAEAIAGPGLFAFDTSRGTNSDFETTHSCELPSQNAFDADIFFAWTADADGDYTFDTSGSLGLTDTQLAVYSGDCMTPLCLGQDDDSGTDQASLLQVDGVLNGQTLLVQIGGTAGATGAGQLTVERVPYGTTCELALEIAGEGAFAYDTTGQATAGFGGAPCLAVEQEFFFLWTAAMDGDYVFHTRSTPHDTRLALYSNDCFAPTCLDSNEDIDTLGGTLQSEVTLTGLLTGQEVLVVVGGPMGVTGPGTLTVDRLVDPCEGLPDDAFEDNDDCASAAILPTMDAAYPGLHVQALDEDFYTIAVPPGEILIWSETADSGFTDYEVFEDALCGVSLMTVEAEFSYLNATVASVDLVVRAHHRTGTVVNCGDYGFDVTYFPDPCLQPDDSFEENDDCASATLLTPGVHSSLQVRDGDADFYRLSIPVGESLTWTELSDEGGTDYRVFEDSFCGVLLSTESGSFTYDNTGMATVELVIEAHWNGTQPFACHGYSFEVAVDPIPCFGPEEAFEDNDDCASAPNLGDGTYLAHFVQKTDRDHFALCVPDGAQLTIDLTFAHLDGDINAYLWEALDANCGTGDGSTELAEARSTDDDEQLIWTNQTGFLTTVILEIRMLDDPGNADCNFYDLTVTGTECFPPTGVTFCDPMDVNSTGFPTVLSGTWGSGVGSQLRLSVQQGPPTEFGFVLMGTAPADPGLPVSFGRLCLDGSGGNAFGRYSVTGQDLNSTGQFDAQGDLVNLVGTSGSGFGFDVPLTLPLPGLPTIQSGETWHFQMWHRDGAGSTFSNGLSVTF